MPKLTLGRRSFLSSGSLFIKLMSVLECVCTFFVRIFESWQSCAHMELSMYMCLSGQLIVCQSA